MNGCMVQCCFVVKVVMVFCDDDFVVLWVNVCVIEFFGDDMILLFRYGICEWQWFFSSVLYKVVVVIIVVEMWCKYGDEDDFLVWFWEVVCLWWFIVDGRMFVEFDVFVKLKLLYQLCVVFGWLFVVVSGWLGWLWYFVDGQQVDFFDKVQESVV